MVTKENSSKKKQNNFNDYVEFLQESMESVTSYCGATGKGDQLQLQAVKFGLKHPDPFVVFRASLAATSLLQDKTLYH